MPETLAGASLRSSPGHTDCRDLPSGNHVDLLIELAAELLGHPWFVLYVLLVPRMGRREPGRYQSAPFDEHYELASFVESFRAFFEGDGRHHIWVGLQPDDEWN